jgi:hypothetical protein
VFLSQVSPITCLPQAMKVQQHVPLMIQVSLLVGDTAASVAHGH